MRTRRTKSSSAGAYSAATWIRWAKGPDWLARTLERTGYPFLQPASALYAVAYQTSLHSVENILGNFVNERDWRIRDYVLTPLLTSPSEAGSNVAARVRVLVPLVVSEPLRLILEGDFRGRGLGVIVRFNGRRLVVQGSPASQLVFLIEQSVVKARPLWNELVIEGLPDGTQLQRITVQSTSRWWK